MAREVRSFSPTVPAGTSKSAGWTSDLSFPPREVVQLSVIVPPGPRGQVGFAIGSAGVPVIPYQLGEWIVTDDEIIEWPLTSYIDSGSWTLFAYNLGVYPHTLQVRFQLNVVGSGGGLPAQPISNDNLAPLPTYQAPAPLLATPPAPAFVTSTGAEVSPDTVAPQSLPDSTTVPSPATTGQ